MGSFTNVSALVPSNANRGARSNTARQRRGVKPPRLLIQIDVDSKRDENEDVCVRCVLTSATLPSSTFPIIGKVTRKELPESHLAS